MDKKIFEEIFSRILKGESIRKMAKEYDVTRGQIMIEIEKNFPKGSETRAKLDEILKYNQTNSSTKKIKDEELEKSIIEYIRGEKTLEEIAKEKKVHIQTLNEKIEDFINNRADKELRKRFLEYQERKYPDYSHINFEALVLEMVKRDLTQIKIAKQYNIPPRTIGRKIEDIKEKEEKQLGETPIYKILKKYAAMKQKKLEISKDEREAMVAKMKKYIEEAPVIRSGVCSKE